MLRRYEKVKKEKFMEQNNIKRQQGSRLAMVKPIITYVNLSDMIHVDEE